MPHTKSTLSLKFQWGSQTQSLKMIVSIDRRDKTTLHMMVTGPKAHAHIHQTSALLPILDSAHLCPVLPLVWPAFLVGALNLHFFGQNSCLQCLYWVTCMHAKLVQLCPTLCDPMDCSPPGSPVLGILQSRILGGLPCPPPGYLPDPGIDPSSLMSPVLAGRFFFTSTTWNTFCLAITGIKFYSIV